MEKAKTQKPFYKRWWFIALAVVFVLGIVVPQGYIWVVFLGSLGFVASIGFLIFRMIKKRPMRDALISLGACFAALVIGVAIAPPSEPTLVDIEPEYAIEYQEEELEAVEVVAEPADEPEPEPEPEPEEEPQPEPEPAAAPAEPEPTPDEPPAPQEPAPQAAQAAPAPQEATPAAAPAPIAAGLTEAVVERVIDGDTIVLVGGERVRFIGIDAPEIGEPGAAEATAFVRERIDGRTVWLSSSGSDRDRFGRLRRYVWVQPPTNTQDVDQIQRYQLNALLVANGHAVVMVVGTEDRAAPPATPPAVATPAPTPAPQTPPTQGEARFIGNINSQVFHSLGCGSLPAPHNRIYFNTREEAEAAGHRPCSRCRP